MRRAKRSNVTSQRHRLERTSRMLQRLKILPQRRTWTYRWLLTEPDLRCIDSNPSLRIGLSRITPRNNIGSTWQMKLRQVTFIWRKASLFFLLKYFSGYEKNTVIYRVDFSQWDNFYATLKKDSLFCFQYLINIHSWKYLHNLLQIVMNFFRWRIPAIVKREIASEQTKSFRDLRTFAFRSRRKQTKRTGFLQQQSYKINLDQNNILY